MYQLNPLMESSRWRKMLRKGELSDQALAKLREKGIYDPYKFMRGRIAGKTNRIAKLGVNSKVANDKANLVTSITNPAWNTMSYPAMDTKLRNIDPIIQSADKKVFTGTPLTRPERALVQAHEMQEFLSGKALEKIPAYRKAALDFIARGKAAGLSDTKISLLQGKLTNGYGKSRHYPGVLADELEFRHQIKPLLARTGDPIKGLGRLKLKFGKVGFSFKNSRHKGELAGYHETFKDRVKKAVDALNNYQFK